MCLCVGGGGSWTVYACIFTALILIQLSNDHNLYKNIKNVHVYICFVLIDKNIF